MHDEVAGEFIRRIVLDEIVPQIKLPREEVISFAESVFERFENPFIDHALLSISLNSISKWKARVLPSFKDYVANNGKLPCLITFSFAALLAFYSSSDLRDDGLYAKRKDGSEYVIHDDRSALEFIAKNANKPSAEFVSEVASNASFWGEDLSKYDGFTAKVTAWYDKILSDAKNALSEVLKG